MCLDLILSAGYQSSKPRSKKRAKRRHHQYLDCPLNFCLKLPSDTNQHPEFSQCLSLQQPRARQPSRQDHSYVFLSNFIIYALRHLTATAACQATHLSRNFMTDRILVPPITTARRAIRGIQFQGICEKENERFIQRAQGCSGREGDTGINAEGLERIANDEGARVSRPTRRRIMLAELLQNCWRNAART